MKPRGATELQHELLEKYVSKDLLDKFQICTSIPGKVPLDPNKINILWQKNSWDQPNLQNFFRNKNRHDEYDWYVFNSHWNFEKFRYFFQLPEDKCMVIKNGVDHFPKRKIYKQGEPIKIIHHCTPWRGLNVLLLAMQYVQNKNVTLDANCINPDKFIFCLGVEKSTLSVNPCILSTLLPKGILPSDSNSGTIPVLSDIKGGT